MPVSYRRISTALFCATTLSQLSVTTVLASGHLDLMEVVVTGTRTEKPILDAPVRTEVVNRTEIEKTHARDLKDALENVPGLMVRENEKEGFGAWLQGVNSDRVLIVVDGEPISPSTGSAVDLSQLATTDIERVEVVKGATAALYGSSAMGGVISIITRKPDAPLSYSLTVEGGGYGDHNVDSDAISPYGHISAKVALKEAKWSLSSSASLRHSEGYDLDKKTFGTEGAEGDKGNIGFRYTYNLSGDLELFIAPSYYYEELRRRMAEFAPGQGEIERNKTSDANRYHTTIGFERRWEDSSRLRGWLVVDNWHDVTRQDVIATSQIDQQRTAEVDLYRYEMQWDKPIGDDHLVTTGLLVGRETMSMVKEEQGKFLREVPKESRENIEAYIQDDIFLSDRWELVPGIRIQEDSDFGTEATPKISGMYRLDWFEGITTNVRLSYGNGYRVPSLKERHFVFDHSALGYIVLGDSNLQTEQSRSYQFDLEFSNQNNFYLNLNLYHNDIKGLIDSEFSHVDQGVSIYRMKNIDRARTRGVEVTSKLNTASGLSFSSGVTYLDAEDLRKNEPLTHRPEWVIKLGIDYELTSLGTSFSLRAGHQTKEWVEDYYDSENQALVQSPAWTTLDLKVNQSLSKQLSVYGGIDNVLDEHRDPNDENDARPYEPRFIYLGLRYEG